MQVHRRRRKLFVFVLSAFLLFAVLLIGVWLAGFFGVDISSDLEKNNYRYYHNKIEQKNLEIERAMVSKWGSEELSDELCRVVRTEYYIAGSVSRFRLSKDVAVSLISMLSDINASGAMLIVGDTQSDAYEALFLRDSNEFNRQASYDDISMEIGAAEIAASLKIPLADTWSRRVDASQSELVRVYREATAHFRETRESSYWTEMSFNGERSMLHVRILTDNEANPIGVVGVEIRKNLMVHYLTYGELTASKMSAYAVARVEDGLLRPVFLNGPFVKSRLGEGALVLDPVENPKFLTYAGDRYDQNAFHVDEFVVIALPLRLYAHGSARGVTEEWVTIAYIPKSEFYLYTAQIPRVLAILSLIAFAVSVVLALMLSGSLVRPLKKIVLEIKSSRADEDLTLRHVGIEEFDLLIDTIHTLTHDIRTNASRLESIMQVLGLPILVIEQNLKTGKVYKFGSLHPVFSAFSSLFAYGPITVNQFESVQRTLFETVRKVEIDDYRSDNDIYEYYANKEVYYLRYFMKRVEDRIFHFVMNYTQEVRNKKRILYERDHDVITSLLNRFAFRERVSQQLTDMPHQTAAMIMWDLDDLKYVNDTYGHDYGDRYLKYAGTVLSTLQGPGRYVSRVSGDEFFAYIPYSGDRSVIIDLVQSVRQTMLDTKLVVSDSFDIRIRATAGIAWYPEDGTSYEELKRYADFAMYTAKNREKGTVAEFDERLYEGDAILMTGREQFNAFIDRRETDFAFQPIVDAKTGEIVAFEALMRPTSAHITNVFDVMRIARMQSKLKAIELLTWTGVLEKVEQQRGRLGNRLLFINSIASINLDEEDLKMLEHKYRSLFRQLVVEITETERLEFGSMSKRRALKERWGVRMAIDDFGTAYSSESVLLEMIPDYLKIDMTIIRGIHNDVSRQKIVENLLDFAHSRGIHLIAEGVECLEEIACLKRIGVPYVQGYYLGMPSLEMTELDPARAEEVRQV